MYTYTHSYARTHIQRKTEQSLQTHTRPELVEYVPAWHRLQAKEVEAPVQSPAVTCAVHATCTSQGPAIYPFACRPTADPAQSNSRLLGCYFSAMEEAASHVATAEAGS